MNAAAEFNIAAALRVANGPDSLNCAYWTFVLNRLRSRIERDLTNVVVLGAAHCHLTRLHSRELAWIMKGIADNAQLDKRPPLPSLLMFRDAVEFLVADLPESAALRLAGMCSHKQADDPRTAVIGTLRALRSVAKTNGAE